MLNRAEMDKLAAKTEAKMGSDGRFKEGMKPITCVLNGGPKHDWSMQLFWAEGRVRSKIAKIRKGQ